jgi:FtsP/CotA-like multicopper oxidase with cupredoxin domain
MHATYANVALGLAGGYVIYDKDVDSKLPTKENEVIIIIAGGYPTNNPNIDPDEQLGHMKRNPQDSYFNSSIPTPIFHRNQTYRFRVLNGEFDAIFPNLKFVAGCPPIPGGYNFTDCKYTLNLSVIGADSTLFDKPVNYVDRFTLASAERIEFLLVINGGGVNNLTSDINEIFFIS